MAEICAKDIVIEWGQMRQYFARLSIQGNTEDMRGFFKRYEAINTLADEVFNHHYAVPDNETE